MSALANPLDEYLAGPSLLVPPDLDKASAVQRLAERTGTEVAAHHAQSAGPFLRALVERHGPMANAFLRPGPGAKPAQAIELEIAPADMQALSPPIYLNGRPGCFPPVEPDTPWMSPTPAFTTLTLRDGYVAMVGEAPAVLTAGRRLAEGYGSDYAPLAFFYDLDMGARIGAARYIDGRLLLMTDDVWGLNYCHWLVDWLPRLRLVQRPFNDLYVAVSPLTAPWQREMLTACGVPEAHILHLDRWDVVQAHEVIAPAHLSEIFHPAYKSAPWALDFLRERLGPTPVPTPRRRLYISRRDARGRRVLNEEALMARLGRLGFEDVSLDGLGVREQAALLASASDVIALHGAGLANLVFCPAGANVVELFPDSYGTPAFWVLAAGRKLRYAAYVVQHVHASSRSQLDDVVVDIADFEPKLRAFLDVPPGGAG